MNADGTLNSRERRQLFGDIIETEIEYVSENPLAPYDQMSDENYVEPEANDASV